MSNREASPTETLCRSEAVDGPAQQLLEGREVPITKTDLVNRTLPHRDRRMVGAWCFVDTYGPDAVITMPGMRVPPHPHLGLQTVSWLLEGAIEHRDSLGSRQLIRPGELNLMTAGRGISHSEESPPRRPPQLHGAQLWIALPEHARDVEPAFAHHRDLPQVELGPGRATVLVGELAGVASPAQVHSPLVGADLDVRGAGQVALDPAFEHAVVATGGTHRRRRRPGRAGQPALPRHRPRPPGGVGLGAWSAAGRDAVRGAARHVVELRGSHARRGRRRPRDLDGRAGR